MNQMMSAFRSSRYIVVKYGYVKRGETLNIAVLAWEHGRGPAMPVYQRVIPNWDRINQTFPRAGAEDFQEDALRRLREIKTVGDYEHVLLRIGPYTPFEFTDERPSTANPEDTLEAMARFFLGPYQG